MEQYKIIFSDIDGTLLNKSHKITFLTEQAIKILLERGMSFVMISARSPSGIYPILEEYGFICPIIAYSGALLLDENRKLLYHKGMKKTLVKEMLTYMEKEQFDLSWCIYSLDQWIVKNKKDPRIIQEENIVKATAKEGSLDDIKDKQINKILCLCNPEQIREMESKLKRKFPEASIVRSSDYQIEIMEKGITKEKGIQVLCNMRKVDRKDCIAFGDNYNDVEMLEGVGCGWLMGNAPKALKQRFPNITADNEHDGIYQALLKMGLL